MPPAERPRSRRWTSTTRQYQEACPSRRRALGQPRHPGPQRRDARQLSPVEHLDAKELERVFKLNVLANQAMIAAFDPLLRRAEKADVIGITSSVGEEPRAFWGGYGASKAAFDTLLGAYADETAYAGKLRVQIVDPGATRTRMRQLAFPARNRSVKPPEVVAAAIVERLQGDAETGSRYRSTARPSPSSPGRRRSRRPETTLAVHQIVAPEVVELLAEPAQPTLANRLVVALAPLP